MKRRLLGILASVALLFGAWPMVSAAAETTVEFPVEVSFTGATGVDLNLRLNPSLVETAELVRPAAALSGATYAAHQSGDKVKVAVASSVPVSFSGTLFYLRLTLTQEAGPDDELCKLLQVKINEVITWQAQDCILLTGVRDGGLYNRAVSIGFNEGTARLDGQPYTLNTPVTAEGQHILEVTDLGSRTRRVEFVIDTTPPVITVAPYDTAPSTGPVTVYAAADEGTLNEASHTFTENGSFIFVAVDAAGNRAEKTVTVSHIYNTFSLSLENAPDTPAVFQGGKLDITGWTLCVRYDNGMEEKRPVTEDMLDYSTGTAGDSTAVLRWNGGELRLAICVMPLLVTDVQVSGLPAKTQYLEGQPLETAGLELTVRFNDNSVGTVTSGWDIEGYDPNAIGEQSVRIIYGGKAASFTVTVTAKAVSAISMTSSPGKTTYLTGETLDLTGAAITVKYNNNTQENIAVTPAMVSGYNANAVGSQTLTVTYAGKTTTFKVTVQSRVPSSITSSVYSVSGGYISKIGAGTTVAQLLNGINEKAYCKVYKGNAEVTGNTPVGTGMEVRLLDGSTVKQKVTVIVTGDTNGDGSITITDMLAVKSHLLKKTTLSGAAAKAADTSGDKAISITDFIQIKAHILGKEKIQPRAC